MWEHAVIGIVKAHTQDHLEVDEPFEVCSSTPHTLLILEKESSRHEFSIVGTTTKPVQPRADAKIPVRWIDSRCSDLLDEARAAASDPPFRIVDAAAMLQYAETKPQWPIRYLDPLASLGAHGLIDPTFVPAAARLMLRFGSADSRVRSPKAIIAAIFGAGSSVFSIHEAYYCSAKGAATVPLLRFSDGVEETDLDIVGAIRTTVTTSTHRNGNKETAEWVFLSRDMKLAALRASLGCFSCGVAANCVSMWPATTRDGSSVFLTALDIRAINGVEAAAQLHGTVAATTFTVFRQHCESDCVPSGAAIGAVGRAAWELAQGDRGKAVRAAIVSVVGNADRTKLLARSCTTESSCNRTNNLGGLGDLEEAGWNPAGKMRVFLPPCIAALVDAHADDETATSHPKHPRRQFALSFVLRVEGMVDVDKTTGEPNIERVLRVWHHFMRHHENPRERARLEDFSAFRTSEYGERMVADALKCRDKKFIYGCNNAFEHNICPFRAEDRRTSVEAIERVRDEKLRKFFPEYAQRIQPRNLKIPDMVGSNKKSSVDLKAECRACCGIIAASLVLDGRASCGMAVSSPADFYSRVRGRGKK
jgi:hypothetical protein